MLKLLRHTGIPVRVSLILFLTYGCQAHYDNEVRSSLTQVYGSDLSDYTFRGTPVGNFGVGTMYLKDIKDASKSPDQAWLIGHLDSMFEEKLTAKEKQQLLDMMIARGSLGHVRLHQDISTNLGLQGAFPSLQGLLNASEHINFSRGVTVVLGASEAINRKLNWTEFKEAVRTQKMKPGIAQHVNEGDFVIAAADLVLVGYKAKISVDKNVNGALNAKLNEVVGKVLGKDTLAQVSVRRMDSGAFEVESVNPVVAAVLFKDPPRFQRSRGTGLLAKNAPGMDEWRDLRLDGKRLEQVEH